MSITSTEYEFIAANIALAPEQAGVYGLYDGNEPIYYGRAQGGTVTIRSRLEDHNSGREGSCTQSATGFTWESIPFPVSREKELLEEYERLHGRLPRCNERV